MRKGDVVKPSGRKAAKRPTVTKGRAARRRSGKSQNGKASRLASELREALAQQSATLDVIQLINSSPGTLGPIFDAIVDNALQICDARFGGLWIVDGELARNAASRNVPKPYREFLAGQALPLAEAFGRGIQHEPFSHVADLAATESYRRRLPLTTASVELGGVRTYLAVPLRDSGALTGVLSVYRKEARPFSPRQIVLLQGFAMQAEIAMKNARLFDEVQAKTRDLSELLQQQTATADVLKVITRSAFDLQAALDALVESATRLCEAQDALIFLPSGNAYCVAARHGYSPEYHKYIESNPINIDRGSVVGRAVIDKKLVHITDVLTDPDYTRFDAQRMAGYRTALGVPLLREGGVIGAIFLTRIRPQPFTERQIELVATFADQAVIAIENARLFEEVQARTHELQETLEYQTAASDVLNIISRSPSNIQPVLETIAETAQRLCHAEQAYIMRLVDGLYHLAAAKDARTERIEYLKNNPIVLNRGSVTGRVAIERRTIQITDAQQDPEYTLNMAGDPGYRTILGVPLLREGISIGVIILTRPNPQPFTEKEVELVTTFADQAVIAVENARLLNELRESLQQQTATADVLKVISRSAFDLQTVFDTLVESAAQLCEADRANIWRPSGPVYRLAAVYQAASSQQADYLKELPLGAGRGSCLGRTLLARDVIQIEDIHADPDYAVERSKLEGYRTMLGVPLLREGAPIGVIVLVRSKRQTFSEKQIELVKTFADQAVIAIENVRLFDEVQARTRELTKSLEELRTTQDRLVQTQKLALLGQLTAGIAHEIKNPLNFVNNFSGISAELIDELRDTLRNASLDDKSRAEIEELADTLKGNFDKVVHHGRRADAIVKNMLQHSREGSGEHRRVDINALVEESLNLAWHGARAETQSFEIKLKQSFDPSAGGADVFPQDIRRALLNLIANGFYATKRKAEANDGDYEPTLAASTKNLGDQVEIRIRDNGTGITPDVKERMFEPFFTTKPTGEGTGLGLSISHDIVVKQHAGIIEVDTQPGAFTEIRIILPRAPAFV